jgi:hypothetical protein
MAIDGIRDDKISVAQADSCGDGTGHFGAGCVCKANVEGWAAYEMSSVAHGPREDFPQVGWQEADISEHVDAYTMQLYDVVCLLQHVRDLFVGESEDLIDLSLGPLEVFDGERVDGDGADAGVETPLKRLCELLAATWMSVIGGATACSGPTSISVHDEGDRRGRAAQPQCAEHATSQRGTQRGARDSARDGHCEEHDKRSERGESQELSQDRLRSERIKQFASGTSLHKRDEQTLEYRSRGTCLCPGRVKGVPEARAAIV